jgi:hypothetical protein
VSLAATAVMAGFGTHGYQLALRHISHLLKDNAPRTRDRPKREDSHG